MAERREPEPMNWADVLFVALIVPAAIVQAIHQAMSVLAMGLAVKSNAIDERRRFIREAHESIEKIAGGGES